MNLQERLLLSLSRAIDERDYLEGSNDWSSRDPLSTLLEEFPDFAQIVTGKRVVDFGCGAGLQSIALAERYGCEVVGVDTDTVALKGAEAQARHRGLNPQQLRFTPSPTPDMQQGYDVVISQNAFEHFTTPEARLAEMQQLIHGDGRLLITFGPPWFAPYGGHMHFFCRLPWLNLLFAESAVMRVRGYYRDDGAARYEEVPGGLNKMTVARFERIVSDCGLKVVASRYRCVKGLDVLSRLPVFRELLINHISVVLHQAR